MAPDKHAVLPPSASERWLNCTPSARLNEKLVDLFGDKGSVYAEEGTRAHALAEIKLRHEGGFINDFLYKTLREQMGNIPHDRDRLTDAYVDEVMSRLYAARKDCPDAQLYVEQRLSMDRWVPRCFGTADAIVVGDRELVVMDFKSGSGVPVDAKENSQARLYGLGAFEVFKDIYDFTHIRDVIIQPALSSVTEEVLTREELLTWGELISPKAQDAWEGKGEFKTGHWCRFCTARAVCAKRVSEALDVFRFGASAPETIPDKDIPRILDMLPTFENWSKDIRAYALNLAKQGTAWDGWKLVQGRRPGRKWTNEEEVKNVLARAGYDESQYTKKGLMSVADLEKELGRNAFTALVGQYVAQGEGALTLAPETDPRPEYSSAEAAFNDLTD